MKRHISNNHFLVNIARNNLHILKEDMKRQQGICELSGSGGKASYFAKSEGARTQKFFHNGRELLV